MTAFSPVEDVTLGAWVALELGLRVRDVASGTDRSPQDRGSRIVVGLGIGGGVGIAAATSSLTPLRGPHAALGVIAVWLGLALRVWSVVTLGRSFRTSVQVRRDQAVVSRGPYRWVRHPSYSALLLILLGIGLMFGSWLGLAACVVLPGAALLWRIRVEEAALLGVLGESYGDYRAHTKRLVPRVW